jgi:HPt (histidine-containing phosphotransfer) domain-containing protein
MDHDDWDRAALRSRFDDDQDVMVEFLARCEGQLVRVQKQLEDAITKGDAGTVRVAAHTLKGTLSYLNAAATIATATRLEHMGRSADLSGAAREAELLSGQIQRVLTNIAKLRTELGFPG